MEIAQLIAYRILLTCVSYDRIIFVGGVTDSYYLGSDKVGLVKDIDVVFTKLDDLARLHGFYGIVKTENEVYNTLNDNHYYTDIDLKETEVRIDLFQNNTYQIPTNNVKVEGFDILVPTIEYMKDFHNKELLTQKEGERWLKHSKKATMYNMI